MWMRGHRRWQGEAEAIVTEAFSQMESKDGYTYLMQEDGAVLLKVPEDLVYFNGNELQDVTIKEIGSNVFFQLRTAAGGRTARKRQKNWRGRI